MSSSILIRGADYVVTVNGRREIIQDAAVYIEHDRIVAVGRSSEVCRAYPKADETIDAKGKAIYPGFINTHTHLFEILLKGLSHDCVLIDWLKDSILPSMQKLAARHMYPAATLGIIEAIKSGTTTILDFNIPIVELSEAVLEAFYDSGIRGVEAHGIIDTGEDIGLPSEIIRPSELTLKQIRGLHERFVTKLDSRLRVWLAPVAIWGVTKEALTGSRALADELKTGITMHIAETPFEAEHCKATFGSKELDLYDSLGFLGPDLLGVHCVYLDDHDLKLVKSRGVKISHNAISNMYLSSGVAPVPRMLEMGITVGLGTDGAASNNNQDMLQLLKVSALLPKIVHAGDPTIITAEKVLEMATIDGARAIGAENEIGSIEKGKKADITIVDLNGVFVAPAHDPISALVYSATSENITDTIVDGKILMRDRKLTALDEGKAIRAANAASEDLLKEAGLSQLSCRLALKGSLGNKR